MPCKTGNVPGSSGGGGSPGDGTSSSDIAVQFVEVNTATNLLSVTYSLFNEGGESGSAVVQVSLDFGETGQSERVEQYSETVDAESGITTTNEYELDLDSDTEVQVCVNKV